MASNREVNANLALTISMVSLAIWPVLPYLPIYLTPIEPVKGFTAVALAVVFFLNFGLGIFALFYSSRGRNQTLKGDSGRSKLTAAFVLSVISIIIPTTVMAFFVVLLVQFGFGG